MNYPAASCEVSENTTHPLISSLEREGKPSDARRGELKSSFEEFDSQRARGKGNH
jgi:hypothetical protein